MILISAHQGICQYKGTAKALKMEIRGLQPSSPRLKKHMLIALKFHFSSVVSCTRGEEVHGAGNATQQTALPSVVPQCAFVPTQQ